MVYRPLSMLLIVRELSQCCCYGLLPFSLTLSLSPSLTHRQSNPLSTPPRCDVNPLCRRPNTSFTAYVVQHQRPVPDPSQSLSTPHRVPTKSNGKSKHPLQHPLFPVSLPAVFTLKRLCCTTPAFTKHKPQPRQQQRTGRHYILHRTRTYH